jgi:PAS domain-containing protein
MPKANTASTGGLAALLPADADRVADGQTMQDFRRQLAESQRELMQSEERYRQLAAASSGIVWVANPDGTFSRDCPSWHAFSGQTHEQGKGFGWTAAVHPDDLPRVLTIWRQTLASGTTYTIRH